LALDGGYRQNVYACVRQTLQIKQNETNNNLNSNKMKTNY